MLFMTKSAVRQQVVQALRPKLNVLQQNGMMPKRFWETPHLVGYLFGEAGFLIRMVSKGKYTGGAAGDIMVGILTDLAED